MIRKIIFKLFLAIISLVFFLFSILYISFIYTDEVIEIFKDEINLSIVKNFPTYDSFTYKSIEGSLSENITIKELSLSSEFKKIEVGKLVLKPSNLSNFYFFIHTILNSTYKSFNHFKLESIKVESLKISENSYSLYSDQILINKKEIASTEVKIDYLDNRIKLFELHLDLNLHENIDLNILDINSLINKRHHLSSKKVILWTKHIDENFTFSDCALKYDFDRINKNIFTLISYDNNCYLNNIKYYFNYDINLNIQESTFERFAINEFTVVDEKEIKYIEMLGMIKFDNMYVDLSINTNKLTYFDFFHPQKGKIDITGQDYLYEISFSLKNIKNLVDSTVDKLKGKFIFNLQGRDKPLINFSSPITMEDKNYKGSIKISDIFNFNDIYYPKIEVRTERINPFKLNQFNQVD